MSRRQTVSALAIAAMALMVGVSAWSQTCRPFSWVNPLPQGNDLNGVAYNGASVWVAVGDYGTVVRSTNLTDWTLIEPTTDGWITQTLYAVCWDGTNSQFVAVGAGGRVLLSADGLTWNVSQPLPAGYASTALYGVAYAGGYLVAVGASGRTFHSTDGATWTYLASGVTTALNGVAGCVFSGTPYFTTVGNSGVMLWTAAPGFGWGAYTLYPATTGNLRGVVYSGGSASQSRWVTVGDSGAIYVYRDWAPTPPPQPYAAQATSNTTANLLGVAWNGATHVALGAAGTVLTSPSDDPWTIQTPAGTEQFQAVIWDGTEFVAAGRGGVIAYSSDGVTWTPAPNPPGTRDYFYEVVWGNGVYVAVGERGDIHASPDGVVWTQVMPVDPTGTRTFYGLAYGGPAGFVAVGASGTFYTSADGITWTSYRIDRGVGSVPRYPNLRGVAWGGGMYVAVGGQTSSGTTYPWIYTSPDGSAWTEATPGMAAPQILNGVAFIEPYAGCANGGFFLAVGNAGTFLWDQCTPTTTWSDISSRVTAATSAVNLNAVIQGGIGPSGYRDYVLFGASGTILSSSVTSGTLTLENSGVTQNLLDAGYDGVQYFAVGGTGRILHSLDHVAWTPLYSPTVNALNGFAWNPAPNPGYVVTGDMGTILHGPGIAASATVSPEPGIVNQDVTFTPSAAGGTGPLTGTVYFGDGNTAPWDGTNPVVHQYTAAGDYAWYFDAVDCTGIVGRYTPPLPLTVVDCVINSCDGSAPNTGLVGQDLTFTGTVDYTGCTGEPAYDWDFGDGSAHGSGAEAHHAYAVAGSYHWVLTVTLNGQSCTDQGDITICALTCTANVPLTALAGQAVLFDGGYSTDTCPNGGALWAWTFGDGGTSNLEDPTHTYTAAGDYGWTLTVTVDGITCTQAGTIEICELTCSAAPDVTSGPLPLTVNFTSSWSLSANCIGTPTFHWDFGDGGTSDLQNPAYVYNTAGTRTWTFTVTVNGLQCTQTGQVEILPYNMYFHDQYERSELCLNTITGDYIFNILSGPHVGESFTGVATVVNYGPTYFLFKSACPYGSPYCLMGNFDTDKLRASASLRVNSPSRYYSNLYDPDYTNSPPCGGGGGVLSE